MVLKSRFLSSLLLIALAFGAFAQQGTHPVTGRKIAPVMGADGADWLNRPEREQEERPEKAIAALHLHPGMQVGEVGAGTGFYSLRIAKQISPGGTVYANDLQPEMLDLLRKNAAREEVSNIQFIQGAESNPHLPAARLDYVLLVDVYHELAHPQAMLGEIAKSLKPDGELVLLEFRKEDPNVPIREEHKMSVTQAKAELNASGFVLDHAVETLPWQHMLFFRVKR